MTIPSSRAKASPINHVRPGGPPCVILYGDRDAELIAEGSKRLAEKLAGAAVDVQLVVAEGQDHAYDLVFRHALDVDESGSRLALGSTTGGLWISEDGGDAWESISTQLPPIYQVLFAG